MSNALWLETDRRYREAVAALGYVRQDQATLSKRATDAGLRVRAGRGLDVEPVAKLEFDKAQWVERLKKLLGEGADTGGRDARHVRRRCSSSTPRTS